jgi:hypothetical protein
MMVDKPLTNQQNQTTFLGINCCLCGMSLCTMLRIIRTFAALITSLYKIKRSNFNGKRQQQYTSGSNAKRL